MLVNVKMPTIFVLVGKKNQKSYQVQAFCEEKGLTPLLGVIWYAYQCWQAGK